MEARDPMREPTLTRYLEEHGPEFLEHLAPIREAVAKLWEHVQHPQYTDHSPSHSERVIKKLDALAFEMMLTSKRLCPREAFYALAAAYLHDVGMQMARTDKSKLLTEKFGAEALQGMSEVDFKRVIREHHARLSAEMIIAGVKDPTQHYDLAVPRDDASYLASIVKGHGLSIVELEATEFDDKNVEDDRIRLRLLAAMLRLADELDVDRRRINLELLKTEEVEPFSMLHWWKHRYVEGASIEEGVIALHFRVPSPKYAEPIQQYVIDRLEREERELREILWPNGAKLRLGAHEVTCDELREEMPDSVWELLLKETGAAALADNRPATVEDYLQVLADDDDFCFASLALPGAEKRIDLESLYVPLAVMERMELEQLQEKLRERTFAAEAHRTGSPEAEPIDIDDALAAHPRLVVLGHPGAGKTTLLKHLVLTFARGKRAQPWIPVYVPLASVARTRSRIEDYVRDSFRHYNLGPSFYDQLRPRMQQGDCIFLFDGLDEVGTERYSETRDEVSKFLAAYPKCHAVVTCRVMSYRNPLPFPSFIVMDLSPEQAQEFADSWFRDDEGKAGILRNALSGNERLRNLAANPFLLTILAIIVEQGRELPKRRAELYDECTAILLQLWDEARNTPRSNLFLTHHKEQALEEVALHFMERGERVFAAADLARKVSDVLGRIDPALSVQPFLREIVENSGILRQLSYQEYDFLHFTFHEYYAARGLARLEDRDERVRKHAGENHWREALLLLAGRLDDATSHILTVGEVNDKLGAACVGECRKFDAPEILRSGLWRLRMAAVQHPEPKDTEERLAGLQPLLADRNGNVRYAALEELRQLNHPGARRLVQQTHIIDPKTLRGKKPFAFEARGQEIVGNADGKHPGMVFIPHGKKGFWMDVFPVTNTQFEAVIKKRKYPRSQYSLHDDSPATLVTWEEAAAYAEKLRKRLPTEEEWELAAAGPAGHKFPWGEQESEDRCRADLDLAQGASRVNTVYADNVSDFGCFEMVGNVWEWTADLYDEKMSEEYRAARGGAWYMDSASCFCGARGDGWLGIIFVNDVGFRCCQ